MRARQVANFVRIPHSNVERRLCSLLNANTGLDAASHWTRQGSLHRRWRTTRGPIKETVLIFIKSVGIACADSFLCSLRHCSTDRELLFLRRSWRLISSWLARSSAAQRT